MKYFITLAFLLVSKLSISQNTFPTSGYVGIGTTSPTSNLTINGTGTIGAEILTDGTSSSRPVLTFQRGSSGFWNIGMNMDVGNSNNFHFRYNGNTYPFTIQAATGNVGIGTTSPAELLQVYSTGQYPRISVQSSSTTGAPGFDIRDASGAPRFTWHYDIGNGFMGFFQYNVGNRMVINNSGNVGIGTTSPDAKLAVSGQVHAQEVKVSVTVPGPDYVFEKDYKLTSLEEIKNYIDQNKHLPEVPSAKEMEKNGVQLGEMNMLLLKKIEELTLYVIELKKEVNELKENQHSKK